VSLKVGKTRLLFISCHLAAGHDKIDKRNEDWKLIYRALVLGQRESSTPVRNMVRQDPTTQRLPFDAIIWMGDFNYRINGSASAITHAMARNMYEVLLNNDQLAFEQKMGNIAWGF
jgi:synaptojanin